MYYAEKTRTPRLLYNCRIQLIRTEESVKIIDFRGRNGENLTCPNCTRIHCTRPWNDHHLRDAVDFLCNLHHLAASLYRSTMKIPQFLAVQNSREKQRSGKLNKNSEVRKSRSWYSRKSVGDVTKSSRNHQPVNGELLLFILSNRLRKKVQLISYH